MTQYPESGIKLVADLTEYKSAMEEAIELAEYFDSIGDLSISVTADVSEAATALEDLPLEDETVNFTVEAEVVGDEEIEDLPLNDEVVNFTVETEVTGDSVEDLPKDGEQIETQLDVQETDTAKETLAAVNTIKNLKILETVWNITGTAVDVFGKFKSLAIDPMLTLEEAVAKVNAQTGRAIPNADKLISGIFYDDLGDSIDQVGNLVIKAEQIGAPVEQATRAALRFTHTWQEESPEQVLDTLNTLFENHLIPNFDEGADLLAKAFQSGANRGGDLLKTLENNAVAIKDLGLTAPEALATITTGMDAGFKSAQDVLGIFLKIKQNVTAAAGNEKSDVSQTLKVLGIANPAETGEAWTAEFFQQVIDGIKNAPGLTDTEKEAMFTNLVGGKQGGKTFSAFLQISPEDAEGIFENVTGAAEQAATDVDDSLNGAIDDFMLAANKAAQEFLSSEQLDLPGKIAALKTGLQDALSVLGEGGTLGDALTVALKPIGFDDEFQSLEKALGDFVIGILQAVAQLQDITGHGDQAAGTRATVAGMAENQLTFNLAIGNSDEIADNIAIAVSRGVLPDQIANSVSSAVTALVDKGAIAQAQELLNQFTSSVDNLQLAQNLNGEQFTIGWVALREGGQRLQEAIDAGIVVNVTPNLTPDAEAALQKQIDDANAASKKAAIDLLNDAKLAAADAKDELVPLNEELVASAEEVVQPLTNVATQTTSVGDKSKNAVTPVKNVAAAVGTAGDEARLAAPPLNTVANSMGNIANSAPQAGGVLNGISGSFDLLTATGTTFNKVLVGMNEYFGVLIATGKELASTNAKVAAKLDQLNSTPTTPTNPNGPTVERAGGGFFGAMVGEEGREIVTSDERLFVLNNRSTEAIMAAMNRYVPGAGYGRGGGNNYAVNNVNYVQSEAQADALGYSTAKTLRGMG